MQRASGSADSFTLTGLIRPEWCGSNSWTCSLNQRHGIIPAILSLSLSQRPLMCNCTFSLHFSSLADSFVWCVLQWGTESRHYALMSIKYPLTVLNYHLTVQGYGEGLKRGINKREEVRSDWRRVISAVWRAGAHGRAVSFWRERRLPLPRQNSGGPSTFGE